MSPKKHDNENTPTQATLEVADGSGGGVIINKAQAAELTELATEAITAAQSAVVAYLKLVKYVRKLDLPAHYIRPVLKQAGFVDSRIAEVLRVANSPDEIFEQYETKTIGFKMALLKTREATTKPKTEKLRNERKRIEEKLRSVIEEFVPVAGKFPAWFPIEFTAQGCAVVVTCKRDKKTKTAVKPAELKLETQT